MLKFVEKVEKSTPNVHTSAFKFLASMYVWLKTKEIVNRPNLRDKEKNANLLKFLEIYFKNRKNKIFLTDHITAREKLVFWNYIRVTIG